VTRMKLRNVLPIVAGLLISALSAAVVLVAGNGGIDRSADASYWTKRITACQDSTLVTTEAVLEYSYDCLKSSIRDAVRGESFEAWYEAASPIMANDIKLEYVCHIPGHDLGDELVEYFDGDFRRAIMTVGFDICGGGIVHGIFDVWGKQRHPLSTWLEISQACIDQNKVRFSTCGDAIGHSAYESFDQDLAAAIRICDMLPEAWIRNSCANGSFMQKYYPQSSALKYTRDVTVPPWGELVDFCDELPYSDPGTMDGCYGGAGWVIGNTIFMNMQALSTPDNEFDANEAQEREIKVQVRDAITACESNVPNNKGNPTVCVDLMLNRMPLFWYMNTEKFEQYCDTVSAGRNREFFYHCLAGGALHMDAEPLRILGERYPQVDEIIRSRNPVLAGLVGRIEQPVSD
jgi:hypothetical protein